MLTFSISPESITQVTEPSRAIVVLGPTGTGKSSLAMAIARKYEGEVVNYDSVQVYRGLDIGSAKTPAHQRLDVPHHLLDILDPHQELTAGEWASLARLSIESIAERGKTPVLVGGTGFYLRALLDGLSPAPGRDPDLRARLAKIADRRHTALHRFLRRFDPCAAARIHPNDIQKSIRAVELTLSVGRPASETQSLARQALTGVAVLKIGLLPDRAALYEALDRRSAAMFHEGLLDETRALLMAGVPPNSKVLSSLGYKQAAAFLAGVQDLNAAITECQTRTRQYAKRQIAWFRAETNVHWLYGFGWDPSICDAALDLAWTFMADAKVL